MKLSQPDFAKCFETLFNGKVDPENLAELSDSANAFSALLGHFSAALGESRLQEQIRVDGVKLGLCLKRFYRDAYGVARFCRWLESISPERLDVATRNDILDRVGDLGVRVNTRHPKKTRVAAVFSLWMSTLRPIYLQSGGGGVLTERATRLEATFNFWLVTNYLKNFGEVRIGNDNDPEDRKLRLRRIWYDLTFRELGLSSLEMFYASIFVPHKVTGVSGSVGG